ncbi:MAG: hypothetical protein HEEMFOPI_00281 [Holosporales bacterium]
MEFFSQERKDIALKTFGVSDKWGDPRRDGMYTPGRMYFYMRSRIAEILKIMAGDKYLETNTQCQENFRKWEASHFTAEIAIEKASSSYARIHFRNDEHTPEDPAYRMFIHPEFAPSIWLSKDDFKSYRLPDSVKIPFNDNALRYYILLMDADEIAGIAEKEADVESNGTYFASIKIMKKTPLGLVPGQCFHVVFHETDLDIYHDWSLNPWILEHVPGESIRQYRDICSSLYNQLLEEDCIERRRALLTELLYYFHTATFVIRGSAAMGEMLEKAFFKYFGWDHQQRTFALVDQLAQVSFGFSGFEKKYYALNNWPKDGEKK